MPSPGFDPVPFGILVEPPALLQIVPFVPVAVASVLLPLSSSVPEPFVLVWRIPFVAVPIVSFVLGVVKVGPLQRAG
jgi:hypothetical protein